MNFTGLTVILPDGRMTSEASKHRLNARYSPFTKRKLVRTGSLSLTTKSLVEDSILSTFSKDIKSSPGFLRSFARNSTWVRGNCGFATRNSEINRGRRNFMGSER